MNITELQNYFEEDIIAITPLSGGDIAHAQKVETKNAIYFVKTASFSNAQQLFEKEVHGLEKLRQVGVINIPKIVSLNSFNETSALIIEFIQNRPSNTTAMQVFGRALAEMHLNTSSEHFGLETNNFIGRLPQINAVANNWAEFYVLNRLLPQLKMALQSGKITTEHIPSQNRMVSICEDILGNIIPALLHGDLWSGNFLISTNGQPYLIDPAVYYGHNEVDLAMSKLFGGFTNDFYNAYHEILPAHYNQKELVEIYQLYYLLVHLNLFGPSYRKSCIQILEKYFS